MSQYPIQINSCDEILIENCNFVGGSPIQIESVSTICFRGCNFSDFSTRTIVGNSVDQLAFENCNFENCMLRYSRESNDWQSLGGVLWLEGVINCEIQNSVFKNCGGSNCENYYSTDIIATGNCRVFNSEFYNCWNYFYNGNCGIDPTDSRRRLFPQNTQGTNNKLINSANFN